ncbi:MAG: MerR family transcriptional regulator [Rhodospirillaceae bacterium]|nr:MerR family transcriptional regulator [Rhodospirillaceae bacterium]
MDETPAPALQHSRASGGKSQSAFRTISEVSELLDLPQHVLRFWETKFPQVEPMKRGGGRRYYRPEDVAVLDHIRALLHDEGYTIKGVQKLLKKPGFIKKAASSVPTSAEPANPADGATPAAPATPAAMGDKEIKGLIGELETVRQALKKSVS